MVKKERRGVGFGLDLDVFKEDAGIQIKKNWVLKFGRLGSGFGFMGINKELQKSGLESVRRKRRFIA